MTFLNVKRFCGSDTNAEDIIPKLDSPHGLTSFLSILTVGGSGLGMSRVINDPKLLGSSFEA